MTRTRSTLALALAAVTLAGAAPAAQADPYDDFIASLRGKSESQTLADPGGDPRGGDAPFAQDTTTVGDGTADPVPAAVETPSTDPEPAVAPLRISVGCRRVHRRFRCVARDRATGRVLGRATARTRKAASRRARRSALATTASLPLARTSALNDQRFPAQTMPSVGKLLINFPGGHYGTCSGTVVSRTLVLTAGHCISKDAQGNAPTQIFFLPGATWTSSQDKLDLNTPYGRWGVSNYWTTNGYLGGDGAKDWALLEIPPADDGHAISDYTGAWNITTGISFGTGARIYAVGYPGSGWFGTAEGHLGRGQYACDSSWDGDWGRIGSGWELWTRCTMNRGASGGPWFVQLNDGSWTIGGINNRCKSRFDTETSYCDPYSDWLRSSYLDAGFMEFWNSVQPLLRH